MKLIKTASGKMSVKMSKEEWISIGKKAGFMKKASDFTARSQFMIEMLNKCTGQNNPLTEDSYNKLGRSNGIVSALLAPEIFTNFLTNYGAQISAQTKQVCITDVMRTAHRTPAVLPQNTQQKRPARLWESPTFPPGHYQQQTTPVSPQTTTTYNSEKY